MAGRPLHPRNYKSLQQYSAVGLTVLKEAGLVRWHLGNDKY